MVLRVNTSSTPSGKRYMRRYRNKKRSVKAIATKALRLANKLTSDVEHKFTVTQNSGAIINDTTASGLEYSLLANLVKGTDADERIGTHIRLQKLEIRMELVVSTSGAAQPIRVLCWYDKPGTVDLTRILYGGGVANPSIVQSPHDPDWRQDYVILHDKVYDLNSTDKSVRNIVLRIPMRNRDTEFELGGNLIRHGDLKFGCISNTPVASPTQRPQISLLSILEYTDA